MVTRRAALARLPSDRTARMAPFLRNADPNYVSPIESRFFSFCHKIAGAVVLQAQPFDPREAIRHLSNADPRLAELIRRSAEFHIEMDHSQSPYDSLLRAIVYQSISGKAARTIFERVRALSASGRNPSPEEILALRKTVLRRAGLSGAKVDAVKDLARRTIDGTVPTLEQARHLSDRELVERLITVRGVGAWTVEMFLIFRLGRPDVLPAHDYGVRKGFALTYGKRRIPTPRELATHGERWRPYRTVASWYMWRAVELAGDNARKITRNSGKKKPSKRRAPAT